MGLKQATSRSRERSHPQSTTSVPRSPESTAPVRRDPVSVICVFNDEEVRRDCLDRSFAKASTDAPQSELIALDNTSHQFPSAGAALNHGVSIARHDYVAFVHQDVYLHSLVALEEAAGILSEGDFGVLGAIGVRADGGLSGRIRDRVVLSGDVASQPADVDSLDEVLFLAPRAVLLEEPLSERTDLAWHAYAVEYGLRLRRRGLRVGAVQLPITHNSLSVNLARLDAAHAAVGATYPAMLPVRTTCGVIAPRPRRALPLNLEKQRWRYAWMRESWAIKRAAGTLRLPTVLSDIRHEIDDLLDRLDESLAVVNLDNDAGFSGPDDEPIHLRRRDHHITVEAVPLERLLKRLPGLSHSILVTNVTRRDLGALVRALDGNALRLGYQTDAGLWLAIGPLADVTLPSWSGRRSRPFMSRAR